MAPNSIGRPLIGMEGLGGIQPLALILCLRLPCKMARLTIGLHPAAEPDILKDPPHMKDTDPLEQAKARRLLPELLSGGWGTLYSIPLDATTEALLAVLDRPNVINGAELTKKEFAAVFPHVIGAAQLCWHDDLEFCIEGQNLPLDWSDR